MWHHDEAILLWHVALAFMLSFAIGFEREVRGAPAGDRTYSLVGTGAAAITAVTIGPAPQAIAGIVTGVGFIGAGFVIHAGTGGLKGITSAASIFAVAAIGIVAGAGHAWLAVAIAALILIDLELHEIPLLRVFDSRRYVDRFRNEDPTPGPDDHP